MKLCLLIIPFLIVACTSQSLIFDKTLIRSNSISEGKQTTFKAPYISNYQKNNYELTFISADHGPGAESQTCKTIKQVFAKKNFKFLIVEGKEFNSINDPADIKRVQECEKENLLKCEEDVCALSEAIKRSVSFAYGEPSEHSIVNHLEKKGYTNQEIAFFYGVRIIPQLKRQGIVSPAKIKAELSQRLPRYSKRVGSKVHLTVQEFESLYSEKMHSKINYNNITTDYVAPVTDGQPTWLNLISHEIGLVRVAFLAGLIEQNLREYKKYSLYMELAITLNSEKC